MVAAFGAILGVFVLVVAALRTIGAVVSDETWRIAYLAPPLGVVLGVVASRTFWRGIRRMRVTLLFGGGWMGLLAGHVAPDVWSTLGWTQAATDEGMYILVLALATFVGTALGGIADTRAARRECGA